MVNNGQCQLTLTNKNHFLPDPPSSPRHQKPLFRLLLANILIFHKVPTAELLDIGKSQLLYLFYLVVLWPFKILIDIAIIEHHTFSNRVTRRADWEHGGIGEKYEVSSGLITKQGMGV